MRRVPMFSMTLLLSLLPAVAVMAGPPDLGSCLDRKLSAAGRHAETLLRCRASAERRGRPESQACTSRADDRLERLFARAEARLLCVTSGDAEAVRKLGRFAVDRIDSRLAPGGSVNRCGWLRLRVAGRLLSEVAAAHGANVNLTEAADLQSLLADARANFSDRYGDASSFGDCSSSEDGERALALAESTLDALYGQLQLVERAFSNLESDAKPARTPGSPGVDASLYPKLVTQYGTTQVDLNSASHTRYRYHDTTAQRPDAVLILVPGFEGGGSTFQILAENAVSRAMERGSRLEVWSFDRRGNQLEDREGFRIARDEDDPQIAIDWYYGEELGIPLGTALAEGPNRRAVFHDPQADSAFMAEWTELVFSKDIDAVVEAARSYALGGNVFLGGHSAGTGFTARYAATDFDFDGVGVPDPGFAKLKGLVLLEGGGAGASDPATEDELDRIEDAFDGGLFFAVRDDAPRCVDGTPCSVATEGVDCAGLGKETCTEPTQAYATSQLLNPRLFAVSEPGIIQSQSEADDSQVVIQLPQNMQGQTLAQVVPDLAGVAVIPPATPEGALGYFTDDDEPVAAFASFIATSLGARETRGDGLLGWQDLAEGPFAADAVPDNGPAPTSVEEIASWGREAEVTRIDRLGLTYANDASNFTDWYYPQAGPGLTNALGIDSTPLSVGRGRTDIENATQAANIDVPVIAFGGTNGLTETGRSFLGFAELVAACSAPSCDGTPRVLDPDLPNPAFPTFGGVAGGYEVHLSEGYAHVDVVTAEDEPDNEVIGPLLDFIERNRVP